MAPLKRLKKVSLKSKSVDEFVQSTRTTRRRREEDPYAIVQAPSSTTAANIKEPSNGAVWKRRKSKGKEKMSATMTTITNAIDNK
ncbi:hypothetical protein FNV43_RR06606 [Rhamnella rubrinervis]|uniref:Uncharacterized protein n=1 Tax=Rhamnella rubrinervis TaxID=2594499 RepID=A0A8K0HDQ6_9ROSA|nr:hypothetical protein FNV43_RR06606 [Rhamnella rubrinervis]